MILPKAWGKEMTEGRSTEALCTTLMMRLGMETVGKTAKRVGNIPNIRSAWPSLGRWSLTFFNHTVFFTGYRSCLRGCLSGGLFNFVLVHLLIRVGVSQNEAPLKNQFRLKTCSLVPKMRRPDMLESFLMLDFFNKMFFLDKPFQIFG